MNPRRNFFRSVLGLGAGAAALTRVAKAQHAHSAEPAASRAANAGAPLPVVTTDIADLPSPWTTASKFFTWSQSR
jgi:hypothetical protein